MREYDVNTQLLIETLINMVGKSHEQIILMQKRINQLECAFRETQKLNTQLH